MREAMSKTRLATHAPIGTVTRIGWKGCPYGPVSSALTGRFACCCPSVSMAAIAASLSYFTKYRW